MQEQQRRDKALRATDPAKRCELVLLRHGETEWNVERRLQGQQQPGPGLNDRGWAQAKAVAGRLAGERFAAIYSSDLLRAQQTAGCVLDAMRDHVTQQKVELQLRPDLRERCLGILEGLTLHQAAEEFPGAVHALCSGHMTAAIEGGETIAQFQARAESCVAATAALHPGGRVLAVAHGGFLQCVLDACIGAGGLDSSRATNCGLSTFVVQGSSIVLVSWDDAAHLEAGPGWLASGFGGGAGGG